MYTLDLTVRGVPPTVDVPAVEEAMTEAARAVMRRSGLKRGQNLVGAAAEARAAAERELERQLADGRGPSGG